VANTTRRGFIYTSVVAVCVTAVIVWVGVRSYTEPTSASAATPDVRITSGSDAVAIDPRPAPGESAAVTPIELAQRDPYAFLELARDRYHATVNEYRVIITKQERIGGKLGDVQEAELRYQREPEWIYMLFRKNSGSAKRALFKSDDPESYDDEGNKYARVEPAGLARLIVADIMIAMNGMFAETASRHSMDRAHFGAFFEMVFQYTDLAISENEVALHYVGQGEVDGRPTIIIERHLPYTGEGGRYPDARLVMHFDAEKLLPAAVYQWADMDEQRLLGRYIYTNLQLNPGFTDDDFKF
jgi:hypothetical protein